MTQMVTFIYVESCSVQKICFYDLITGKCGDVLDIFI